MTISPETVDDWEEGYFVAYPDDGSKLHSISPSFVREKYVPTDVDFSKNVVYKV